MVQGTSVIADCPASPTTTSCSSFVEGAGQERLAEMVLQGEETAWSALQRALTSELRDERMEKSPALAVTLGGTCMVTSEDLSISARPSLCMACTSRRSPLLTSSKGQSSKMRPRGGMGGRGGSVRDSHGQAQKSWPSLSTLSQARPQQRNREKRTALDAVGDCYAVAAPCDANHCAAAV